MKKISILAILAMASMVFSATYTYSFGPYSENEYFFIQDYKITVREIDFLNFVIVTPGGPDCSISPLETKISAFKDEAADDYYLEIGEYQGFPVTDPETGATIGSAEIEVELTAMDADKDFDECTYENPTATFEIRAPVIYYCEDSDGDYIYGRGEVEYGVYVPSESGDRVSYTKELRDTYMDSCVDEQTVQEIQCVGGDFTEREYDCPDTHECKNGACVLKGEEPGEETFCDDSDEDDIFERGSTRAGKIVNGDEEDVSTAHDECISSELVLEFICDGDEREYVERNCPADYTCVNGACVKKQTTRFCYDSDNGKNYYERGKTNQTVKKNGDIETSALYEDECTPTGLLKEYYCIGDSDYTSEVVHCPDDYHCSGGRCVKDMPQIVRFTLSFKEGWNAFSIPVENADIETDCEGLLNTENGEMPNVWKYDRLKKQYVHPSQMITGEGYWYKADGSCAVEIEGSEYSLKGKALGKGWNFIGSSSSSDILGDMLLDCTVDHGPWEWSAEEQTYKQVFSAEPGKGYFIKADEVCIVE